MSNFGSPSRLSQATWLPQRQTQDEVTAWGSSSVDQTIKRLTTGYDVRGLVVSAESYGTGTAAKNTVGFQHNGWRQFAQETQGHDGGTARTIVYGYETGTANTIRRTSVTYPSGQTSAPVQNYAYTGTHANALSRVSSIRDGSTDIISYACSSHPRDCRGPANVPATHLCFGTAADHYAGLDRFGRPISVVWLKGSTASVKAQYRYDRSSNRQWRYDAAAHAAGVTTEDQWYEYDGLYQVRGFQRGTLVGTYPNFSSLSPVAQNESWNYDDMGNWLGYTNDTLSQTRQFNKVNEITSLAGPTGAVTPLYDPTGNMTTMPAVADWTTAQTLKWDAWNRLVKVSEGTTTIAEYTYDALFRRITKTVGSPGSTTTRRFYYNDQWQILEEYVGTATNPEARYCYGLCDINDIARRQRYSTGTTLHDDLYALRETMNVVALVNASGAVTQRMAYDAFGNARFMEADWDPSSNNDGWLMLFHAHYHDSETGLYQMRFRSYHPLLGTWLNRDPIGESLSLDLFCFCGNNPVQSFDPRGLFYVHFFGIDLGQLDIKISLTGTATETKCGFSLSTDPQHPLQLDLQGLATLFRINLKIPPITYGTPPPVPFYRISIQGVKGDISIKSRGPIPLNNFPIPGSTWVFTGTVNSFSLKYKFDSDSIIFDIRIPCDEAKNMIKQSGGGLAAFGAGILKALRLDERYKGDFDVSKYVKKQLAAVVPPAILSKLDVSISLIFKYFSLHCVRKVGV